MIQITAPVSPGSSGSPVLDESGDVIGMATQVLREGQNLNFAISAETIRDAIAKSSSQTTPDVAMGSAEDYHRRALHEIGNRDYQSAVTDCTEAIRLAPNFSDFYDGRADAYDNLGKSSEAPQDRNSAKEIAPSNHPL